MGLLTDIITGKLKTQRAINAVHTLQAKAYALRYEGGQRSRNRGFAQGTFQSPEDTTNTAERLHMINEARDLEVNDPVAGMILNIFDVYAFGVIRYQPMTDDTAFNAEISAYLKEWMKTASYCGRHDFQKIAQLAQRGKKRDAWEGGHREPFIARWPARVAAGSTSDQTLCLTDLMATAADIAGFDLPANAGEDSFSMLPALLGEADRPIREATVHHSVDGTFAIRQGKWKLIDGQGPGSNQWDGPQAGDPPGQLYDIEADRHEDNNIYNDHPETVEKLKALLEKYKQQGHSRAG